MKNVSSVDIFGILSEPNQQVNTDLPFETTSQISWINRRPRAEKACQDIRAKVKEQAICSISGTDWAWDVRGYLSAPFQIHSAALEVHQYQHSEADSEVTFLDIFGIQLKRFEPGANRVDNWMQVAGEVPIIMGEFGDNDPLDALPRVLERFPVANVLWAGPYGASQAARALEEFLAQAGLQPTQAETGQALDMGRGACLRVVAVTKRGAVLLLEWKSFHALLPIGADFESLERLTSDPELQHIEALLLADSGYGPANPPEWINRLRPQVVLLSVSADDWDGRPDVETLQALEGYTLLRTDRNGWIHLSTDGEQMWVEVERSR